MYLRDIIDQINKEKRKREIQKVAEKLASGIGFGAAAGLAAAIIIYAKPRAKGHSEIKHGKKEEKEVQHKMDEAAGELKEIIEY